MAQMVKNPPAMLETWVRILGWEGPLEEGMATHSSILAWRIPLDREAYSPWGLKEWNTLSDYAHSTYNEWFKENYFPIFNKEFKKMFYYSGRSS